MRMRFLGKTGLQVSELCLGTGSFGGTGEFKKSGEIGQQEADYIVSLALDSGINFFNTAELYSFGEQEQIHTQQTKKDHQTNFSHESPRGQITR